MVKIWLCRWGSLYVSAGMVEELLQGATLRLVPGAQQYKLRIYTDPSTGYIRYINAEKRARITALPRTGSADQSTVAAQAAI